MINKIILFIVATLLAVFTAVFLLRLILILLINFFYRIAKNKRQKSDSALGKKSATNNNHFVKEDEELLRERLGIPKSNSEIKAQKRRAREGQKKAESNYETIESLESELENQEFDKPKIVGVVKPIGKWTAMILGEKLSALINYANYSNDIGDGGFWEKMIRAKTRSADRQRTRGR